MTQARPEHGGQREPSDFDDIEYELSSSWREACGGYSAMTTVTPEAAAKLLGVQSSSRPGKRVWSVRP